MVFQAKTALVLASGSPRRRRMFADLGLEFLFLPGSAPEPDQEPGEAPEVYAVRAARAKGLEATARDEASQLDSAVVVAADTVVAIEGAILGKPADQAEALAMLKQLAGKTHVVVTGCWLGRVERGEVTQERTFAAATEVDMQAWPEAALAAYAATGEPLDKAGAYGIQGLGSFLVREVRGSYTNVVGLPLTRVLEVLLSWGVVVPKAR